jgi:DNA repair exonuclease SbcCD nuclease subunit
LRRFKKAIVTADWHLRKAIPPARPEETEEDWMNFQFKCVEQVFKTAKTLGIPVFHIGDLFDTSQPYYGVVNRLIRMIEEFGPENFYKLAGNHDLPYNTMDNELNSGWAAVRGNDLTEFLDGAFHFGERQREGHVVATHQLVYPNEKARPPTDKGKTAAELVEEFSAQVEWILLGDYHKAYHVIEDECHVVNPGCLNRQKVSEKDYTSGFFIVDFVSEEVEFVEIDDKDELVEIHLQNKEEREERLSAFIELVQEKGKVTFSFSENLEKKLKNKKIPAGVIDIIREIQEETGVNK